MHEYAKELIEKRIDKLISEWDFEIRKKDNTNICEKCNNTEDLNCLFCFCPHYDLSVKEGACKINSPDGKYVDGPEGKILDCSNCDFMHKPENVKKYLLSRIYNL
jgi:Zn-finger protein